MLRSWEVISINTLKVKSKLNPLPMIHVLTDAECSDLMFSMTTAQHRPHSTAQGSGYVQWWPWVDAVTCWAAATLCTHQDKQLTTTCWMDCFCFHSFDLCNIFVIECMFHFHCDPKRSCAHVLIHPLLDQVSGVPASVDFRVHGHSKYFTTFYSDQQVCLTLGWSSVVFA